MLASAALVISVGLVCLPAFGAFALTVAQISEDRRLVAI